MCRDFNQIKAAILSYTERFFGRLDSELCPIQIDKTYVASSNLVVNAWFRWLSYVTDLPWISSKNDGESYEIET